MTIVAAAVVLISPFRAVERKEFSAECASTYVGVGTGTCPASFTLIMPHCSALTRICRYMTRYMANSNLWYVLVIVILTW